MDRWEGRSSNANAKTSCFHVRPAAVRNRRLKKSVWVWGFFFQWVFFFSQHLKSDLQLLIKNEFFFQNQESLCTEKGAASYLNASGNLYKDIELFGTLDLIELAPSIGLFQ